MNPWSAIASLLQMLPSGVRRTLYTVVTAAGAVLALAQYFDIPLGIDLQKALAGSQGDAVIAGLGVGLGNTMLAGADLEAGRLVKPFELSLKLETGYFLVYWPGALKRPKIKAFRDWMIDQVGSVAGG